MSQQIIIAAEYAYRTGTRTAILGGADASGNGIVELYDENDPHWVWRGNFEDFNFYWNLKEPVQLRGTKSEPSFWKLVNQIQKDLERTADEG